MEKKKILICDDELGVRESLKLVLKDNYGLSFCHNGQECLDKLSSEKFDLLLLDIKMPKKSGLDTLRSIKEKNSELKVIMITGYATMDAAQEAFQAGAYDYIIKPFSGKDLLQKINGILN